MSDWLEELWYPKQSEGLLRRAALSPLGLASGLFELGVSARNALYDRGALPQRQVPGVRIVSVGNLNVGGAGKTPAVIHLAQRAIRKGLKVAVLSRGYGRSARDEVVIGGAPFPSAETAGDEPLLIARRCPGVTVLVGPDRARLAERARAEFGAELLLLDDGLQHRRLARDEEVVVIDEVAAFGNGRLMPRGPLREPLSALDRATLIWLRAGADPSARLPAFDAPVVRTRYFASGIADPSGTVHGTDVLRGRMVFVLCGLARPGGFLLTLRQLGMDVVAQRFFPDHHPFGSRELTEAADTARRLGAVVVTTEKDGMRIPAGSLEAWVVQLDVQVIEGEQHVHRVLGT